MFQHATLNGVVLLVDTLYQGENTASRRYIQTWFLGEYSMNIYDHSFQVKRLDTTWEVACVCRHTNIWKQLCRRPWWRTKMLYLTSAQHEAYQLKS